MARFGKEREMKKTLAVVCVLLLVVAIGCSPKPAAPKADVKAPKTMMPPPAAPMKPATPPPAAPVMPPPAAPAPAPAPAAPAK